MIADLTRLLPSVQKPARYTGGEFNEIKKQKYKTSIALCFPDTYEIGMSNLGLKILYGLANELSDVRCERVFAPWGDMEDKLRENNIPLYTLESHSAVSDFDMAAFSLGYELCYTTVLNMLDLANIPIHANDRKQLTPLVIAGGTCTYNPEPLADFIDLFVIGEGEEVFTEIIYALEHAKQNNIGKHEFLKSAAKIKGVYVPSLYNFEYNTDGTVKSVTSQDAPIPVVKRIVEDLSASYFPHNPIVASTEIVHDRAVLELFRGCIRGCRFCQAGYVYRPVRSKDCKTLVRQGVSLLENTGYEEITLSSLSTSDYRELSGLADGLLNWCEPRSVNLSLPSLRADNFSLELMERVSKVRRSGLTFAPEAGSQRLRDVINKNVTEDDLINSCRIAFEGGWSSVKLYFMLGLPTETDEDVKAISDLVHKVIRTWKLHSKNKARGVKITVGTSCFIPKPHTPFQWEPMITTTEYLRKVQLLQTLLKTRAVTYNWHDSDTSLIESVLSRGDRRLCSVIEHAWRYGAKLESWSEYFSLERWIESFKQAGLSPEFYAYRVRDTHEKLPWNLISVGVSTEYLQKEHNYALNAQITPDCRKTCTLCGASQLLPKGKCDE